MRVGRSLIAGKVFFEKDGIVRLVRPEELRIDSKIKSSGFQTFPNGMMIQWGISESETIVSMVEFPQSFSSPPHVSVSPPLLEDRSPGRIYSGAILRDITNTSFHLVAMEETVRWVAMGLGPS